MWEVLVILIVFASITALCLHTHPGTRVPDPEGEKTGGQLIADQNITNVKHILHLTTRPHTALLVVDWICTIFFTIEWIVRLALCPGKRSFFTSFHNIVDILCVLPTWINLIMEACVGRNVTITVVRVHYTLSTIRALRIFRVFKVGKRYDGLRVLLLSMKASMKELLLLVVFLAIAVLIFSFAVFVAELDEDGNFDSVFIGFWWSIITMTTVGYGDKVPRSLPGYLVGGMCAVTGLIIIGLPVPVIASNFGIYYGHLRQRQRMKKRV